MSTRTVRYLTEEQARQRAASGRQAFFDVLLPSDDDLPVVVTDGTAVLRLYDVIDSWGGFWGVSASQVAAALDGLPEDVATIEVHLNCPGGEATEGIAIGNLLRQDPRRVVAVTDGLCASAATVVAMGADEVVMAPGSQLMIHDASGGGWGPADWLQQEVNALHHLSDSYAAVYALKAGGSVESWRAAMKAETWFSPAEAVAAGLADRLLDTPTTDDPASKATAHDLRRFAYAGREHAPAPRSPAPPSASGSTTTPALEADMSLSDALRERLGIADPGADEGTILAALDEALIERADPPTDQPVTPAALAEVTRLSSELAQIKAAQAKRDRDERFAAWLREGKTSAAERGALEAMYDAAPEQTAALIDARAAGSVVPVAEIGVGSELSAQDALYAQLFGAETKVG